MARSCGIYIITCTVNKRSYVGGAANILTRWAKHRLDLKRGTHWIKSMNADWKKHGASAFSFTIAEECTAAELNDRETYWLKKLKPWVKGYNTRKDSASRQQGIKHKKNRNAVKMQAQVKADGGHNGMAPKPGEFTDLVATRHEKRMRQLMAARDKLHQDLTSTRVERMQLFLTEFRERGIISRACVAAGISRGIYYVWLEKYPDFAARADQAEKDSLDNLREEARRRGEDGVIDDVYHQGEVVGQVRIYSDALLKFVMAARAPDEFGKHENHKHSGSVTVEPTQIYLPTNGREVVVPGTVVKDEPPKGILP